MQEEQRKRNGGYTFEHGRYENAPYHHLNSKGDAKSGKSLAPRDGQRALDNSVSLGATTTRRLGVSCGQLVILSLTSAGLYHGHVATWEEIQRSIKLAKKVIDEMVKMGLIDRNGNPLV
jgi:hypothetical protein